MTIYIGEIPIHYVSSFDTDRSLKGIEEIHFLGIDSIPHLSEQPSNIRDFGMVGTLLQDSGVIPTIDDMAEDVLALKDRRSQFNYIHDFQNRTGWLGIKDAGSEKNASSLVTRPYVMSGKFLPKALYQTRMHSNPIIRSNDFSFALGTDDCDNYIAIPIGATYLGGDGSTITRTSKDGDITLVKATVDNNIRWDIKEADRLNGECKIFDMMSENLLKNDDFEDWSDGASSAPDGWELIGAGATIARDTGTVGSYAANITYGSATCRLQHLPAWDDRYKTETFTLQGWLKTSTADMARLRIWDGVDSTYSGYHTGGGGWELLSVTRTLWGSATEINAQCIISGTGNALYDGLILVEASEAPTTPVLDTYGVQVYVRDREFTGSMIIENGLYRILINPSTDHITLYYYDGSDYIHISAFSAGTFTRTTILENTPDRIRVKLDSDVEIELRRGHPPMIDTGTTDLITIGLTPADQSTTTENYLSLGTNLYICSDESFSIVNATQNLDDGKKWIFYETVSATAEDIAHQAMVNARENRELIQR